MDYKFWISMYAASISTIVFVWRLFEFYYDRVGKLNISIKTTWRTNIYIAQAKVVKLSHF